MPVTNCSVCDKEIEITQEEYSRVTEPLCDEHKDEEVVKHGENIH